MLNNWIVALTDGDDNTSKNKYRAVIKLLDEKPSNIIIITVGKLDNQEKIIKICTSVQKYNKIGKYVQIENGHKDIKIIFKKVIQVINGQLHVDSL